MNIIYVLAASWGFLAGIVIGFIIAFKYAYNKVIKIMEESTNGINNFFKSTIKQDKGENKIYEAEAAQEFCEKPQERNMYH